MTSTDSVFQSLSRDLISFDLAQREVALATLAASNDVELFERLLAGEKEACSPVLPDYCRNVFLDVLAMAPDESSVVQAARERITGIMFYGRMDGLTGNLNRWVEKLPKVWIVQLGRIRVVGGLHHPVLQRLEIEGAEVDDLNALAKSPALKTLVIKNTKNGGQPLRDLSALKGATQLTGLTVASAELTDVSGLKDLPALTWVDLTNCSSLSNIDSLVGHPGVRAVLLHGTAVDKESVAAPLRKLCSWARDPNFQKMMEKEPQKPPAPKRTVEKGVKSALSQVKKLVESANLNDVKQGIELAVSSGDVRVFDELLAEAKLDTNNHRIVAPGWKKPTGFYALYGLVANAPVECAVATQLKGEITRLALEGPESGKEVDRPFDLNHLRAFPNLALLDIKGIGPILPVDASFALPKLEELRLYNVTGLTDLSFVRGCTAMKKCTLHGLSEVTDLTPFEGHPMLESISLWRMSNLTSLQGIAHIPQLDSLHLHRCLRLESLGTLANLPKLYWVQMFVCPRVDLTPLRGLPALKRIRLDEMGEIATLDALAGHPRLDEVELVTVDPPNVDMLGTLSELRSVYLYNLPRVASVACLRDRPHLWYLSLDRCPKLKSLEGLKAPPIRHLAVDRCGVKDFPPELQALKKA